jgi:hypothetical protein
MSEHELTPQEQVKLLEDFIFNNEDLEALESIVDKFNIFSSLGIINQEVRHSNFLAWLLDPNETHNLSEYFTTSFLKLVAYNNPRPVSEISLVDIDTLDLSGMQVYREWNNIDVLMVDDVYKLVCVIENKVDSKEHSNQLKRYKELIEANYPGYRKLYVFLTAYGESPEAEEIYIPIRYSEVSELVTTLIERKGSQLSDEVNVFIRHYNEMIKRYIMEESEVQELCEKLYKKHKRALDLIFKHKPDIYTNISEALTELVENHPALIKDHVSKSYVRFIGKELDFFPKEGEGWTSSKRMLLFEIQNYGKAVDLFLIIGPGPSEVRESIFNHSKNSDIFKRSSNQLPKKWSSIYKTRLSTIAKLEGMSKEDIKETLQHQIDTFMSTDYPKLAGEILKLKYHSGPDL